MKKCNTEILERKQFVEYRNTKTINNNRKELSNSEFPHTGQTFDHSPISTTIPQLPKMINWKISLASKGFHHNGFNVLTVKWLNHWLNCFSKVALPHISR